MSFNSMRKRSETVTQNQEPEVTNQDENATFTDEQLQFQWLAMCQRMPQEMSAMSQRMKNIKPAITQFPEIEVVIDNQFLLDQMANIKKRIQATLAQKLHNGNITINFRVAKADEVSVILSRKERYEKLLKENPALERLRSVLDLELS